MMPEGSYDKIPAELMTFDVSLSFTLWLVLIRKYYTVTCEH